MVNKQTVQTMAEDVKVDDEVQKLKKELKQKNKKKNKNKKMNGKKFGSKRQREEIKNLKLEKNKLSKKLKDSRRQRAELKELLQIKMEQHRSSLNEHAEQMDWQCRLAQALQNQAERLQGYFGEY